MKLMPVPTWSVVALGLALNIGAALLTHLKVDQLSQKAGVIEQKRNENSMLISQIWQKIETLERKKEWLPLYFLGLDSMELSLPAASEGSAEAELLMMVLDPWVEEDTALAVEPLVFILNDHQQVLRESIDGRYLDNLQYVEQHQSLMREMAMFRNVALFMQLIGLALILARDLRPKDNS